MRAVRLVARISLAILLLASSSLAKLFVDIPPTGELLVCYSLLLLKRSRSPEQLLPMQELFKNPQPLKLISCALC